MNFQEFLRYGIPLIVNFIFYFSVLLTLFIKKKYTSISIRSPTLLILNIFSGWILTSLLIINIWQINTGILFLTSTILNIISCLFYPFQFLIIITFALRCLRIVTCCKITQNINEESKTFINQRNKYMEQHYIKLMFLILGILLILVTLFDVILWIKYDIRIVPNIFFENNNDVGFTLNSYIWICICFIENFVLITFCYLTSIKEIQHKIREETYIFTFCWISISYLISASDFRLINKENHKYSLLLIILIVFYICLVFNGILPIILSFQKTYDIRYHFHSKLMNNFYLFLTNEDCYEVFSFYLERKPQEFFLRLYTHIMKFKLEIELNPSLFDFQSERNQIVQIYFTNTIDKTQEFTLIAEKIRNFSKNSNKSNSDINNNYNIFDEALTYSYEILYKCFIQFKYTEQFKLVSNDIDDYSYLQCKMNNTGLIGKF